MTLLIWVGVVFLSILVHELGHALTMRHYGQDARIVLYMMGGLAIPESAWGGSRGGRGARPLAQILISAAGPAPASCWRGWSWRWCLRGEAPCRFFWFMASCRSVAASIPNQANEYGLEFVNSLLWVNIFWGLLNLLPVNPLDGGQIAREMLTASDPWEGMSKSLWLSVFVGAAVAVVGFVVLQDRFLGIFFALLAFSNFMAIQNLRGRNW